MSSSQKSESASTPKCRLKEIPRYECLLDVSRQYPELNPASCEAFLYLLRTGDELARGAHSYFSRNNISNGRFLVLILLFDCARGMPTARTPAELADLACCTRATMTGLIDTLERDGLVRRVPDEHDRRMMHVEITDHGKSVVHGLLPEHFRRITHVMSALSEDESRMLVRLLQKVLEKSASLEPLEHGVGEPEA